MKLVRVGDISVQVRGVSYNKSDVRTAPAEGYSALLRGGNIGAHGLILEDLQYVPTEKVSEKQILRNGDVVLVASSGSLDVVGKAAAINGSFAGTFGAFCKVLRPSSKVDHRYFAHYFKTSRYRRTVSSLAAGANINNLKNEHLNELEFPLPTLSEQRRIADILDKADALRAKRRDAIKHLDALSQSIFHEMFGGEQVVDLGSIAKVSGGKRLPKGSDYSTVPTPFPYIRVADLRNGYIDTSSLRYLDPEIQAKIARYTVESGDVIVSIAGSIGVVAAVPEELAGANLTENAARIRPLNPRTWDPHYLSHALRSPNAQAQIAGHTGRVTIGKLALFRIEKITIPLPSFDDQQVFAARVRHVTAIRDQAERHLNELDNLFLSLQDRAFKGEL